MARRTVRRTGAPLYPEHPSSEHRWRLDRARRMMTEDNLDVLLLARNVNVFYATGSRFVFVDWGEPAAIVPQTTAIITRETDIYCQRFGPFDNDATGLHTTWAENLEFYDDELELVNILTDYGVGKGSRIGTEWGPGLVVGINPIKFLELKKRLEHELGAEVVDGTATICRTTAVKSALEIERMRIAVVAAARAMQKILDEIEVGMSEVEVARRVRAYMLQEGGDKGKHAQVMGGGDGSEMPQLSSTSAVDREIRPGFIQLDIGCKYRGYGSDLNRGIFLGREPTNDEKKLYECRLAVSELMDEKIRPGVCMDDLLIQMNEFARSRGCEMKEIGGTLFGGHSLGLEPYQHPNMVLSSAQPEFQNAQGKVLFEKGMVFTYEPALELPGSDCPLFNIEDDVVVTESGVENMSAMLGRELRVKLSKSRSHVP